MAQDRLFRALVVLGMALSAACRSGTQTNPATLQTRSTPDAHEGGKHMNGNSIALNLLAEPLRLTLSERKDFKISISATNRGSQVIDPELHRAELFINGKASKAWSLAIGNGRREAKWSALPPGDTVSMTWSTLGESLFPAPGQYSLVLRHEGTELAPIHVEVLAG
jgi:hypothetical protein